MIMDFNFGNLKETSFVSESQAYLKPFDIYKVNLTKIEKTVLKGKNDIEYPIVALQFNGIGENKGIFKHNLFIPTKESDFERRKNETSGTSYPSAFEQYQYTLMQLLQVINPEGAKKIIENSSKIKSIDQFTDLIIKGLNGKDSVEIYLKLVGRNVNGVFYATLPNACVLSREATEETKPSVLNFVSTDETKLSFSNYEYTQMKQYKSAKPTNMDTVDNPDTPSEDESFLDDIEF